jgi:F0F1-type ATP synthase membrane subunit b/b'
MNELAQKISTLEDTKEETLIRARAEAADLKKKILVEAKEKVERYQKEVRFQMDRELQRAKQALKDELMRLAIERASSELKIRLSKEDHSKLLSGFTNSLKETAL